MDPLLKEITESTPRDRESRFVPDYADPESFAARTPGAAVARNVRTALEGSYDDKTFAAQIARFVGKLLLGSPNPPTILDKEGRETLNPAHAMDVAMGFGPGILAGPKGAVNLGGQRLQRYRTGETVAETGVPSQELWRSYGYAKGAEGKGRFEISDVPAKLKPGAEKAKTVGEALEHPELFAAYPELAKLPLELRINQLLSMGRFHPDTGRIVAQGFGEDEAKSVLLHELQHGVQRKEGFSPGASLRGGAEQYERSAGEQEAYNVQRRLENPDLMRFTPEMTERLPREMQIIIRAIQDANQR